MAIYSFIAERASSEKSSIASFACHEYSHLMKIVRYDQISPSWVYTVLNSNIGLYEQRIVSINKVMSNQHILDKIKYDAIKEYHKDGNTDGERMFEIIKDVFPSIMDLRDPIKVTDYLIMRAKQTGCDFIIKECKEHLAKLKL